MFEHLVVTLFENVEINDELVIRNCHMYFYAKKMYFCKL